MVRSPLFSRKAIRPALAALLALCVAGCGQSASPVASESGAEAGPSEGPTAAPGLTLSDAVVQLPLASGAPGVAYFTLTLGEGPAKAVAAVDVAGVGKAELHETKTVNGVSSMAPVKDLPLEPGKPLVFAPGGLHVMLFEVSNALKAGGSTDLTVLLANGDKISTKAAIKAGPAGMDHSGMDHGAMDHGAMDHE